MNEFTIDVEAQDGAISCFAAHPAEGGPFPPVILYMDAPGIREELRDFARRIAAQGYFCLLPDMYYRLGEIRFDVPNMSEADRKKMFEAMDSLSIPKVVSDTKGMLAYLDSAEAASGPVGGIGYCMSGQYVVAVAGSFPDRFAAAASLYGVRIVTDEADSPHLLAPQLKAELYLGFAETDPYIPDNVIPTLEETLSANDVAYRLDIFPGTEHGFCFPQRPVYHQESAEQTWEKIFDMYERKLQNG